MSTTQNFDLTPRMAPFLDVHMIAPLLDFVRENGTYDLKKIALEKIRIFVKTNMLELVEEEIAFVSDLPEIKNRADLRPEVLEARKDKIFDKMDHMPEDVQLVTSFFANEELIVQLKSDTNLTIEYISTNHGISASALESYYKYSKFKYDCGMYTDSEEMLVNYLSVSQPQNACVLGALWGRLACRILQAKWEESLHDLLAVKEAIESRGISPMDQIRHRAWLLHWSLFVYPNQPDGLTMLVDIFTDKVYLQTLENVCPWLLRYLSAAAVLCSRRRSVVKDVLAEIQTMAYAYSDPITQLIEAVYEHFDFEMAQQKLKECQALAKGDFFLQVFTEKFVNEIRLMIIEAYCIIHKRIDISTLANILELSEEDTEKWMVEMVRGTLNDVALDARIDSSGKQVIMASPSSTVYQTIIERTRDLTLRSGILSSNLEALLQEQGSYLRLRKQQEQCH